MIDNKSPYAQKPTRTFVTQKISESVISAQPTSDVTNSEEFFKPADIQEMAEQSVESAVEQIVEQSGTPIEESLDASSDSAGEEIVQNSETSTQPTTHFFKCRKPDGTEVVYKKSTAAKTYATDLPAYRKYLAGQGIEILEEYFE